MRKLLMLSIITLALFLTPHVQAAMIMVQGTISNPGIGGTVTFKNSFSQKTVSSISVSASGTYSIALPEGVYDITFTPISGAGVSPETKYHQQIGTATVSNFAVPSPKANYFPGQTTKVNSFVYIAFTVFVLLILGCAVGFIVWKQKKYNFLVLLQKLQRKKEESEL